MLRDEANEPPIRSESNTHFTSSDLSRRSMKGKTKRVSEIMQLTESLDSSTNSCVTDLLVLYYTMGKRSQIQCEMSLRIQLTMNLNLCLCLKGKKKVGALRMEGGRD